MSKAPFKKFIDSLTSNNLTNSENSSRGNISSSSQSKEAYNPIGIAEELDEQNFQICKTVRHGFPHKPTAIAYDPLQQLLVIGCQNGSIRVLGQPGVDSYLTHDSDSSILQLLFLSNEGALLSVCADNSLHLWNLRQKKPVILQSLQFKRERITFCHLPHKSSWIYIGTDKGNTNLCHVETFSMSGYTIYWNKVIEKCEKSNPGPVICLIENPVDESKLLIAYQSGLIVLWDLKSQYVEKRFKCRSVAVSTCWHSDGKQFMCGHLDGSLSTWDCRNTQPVTVNFPHGKNEEGNFNPIDKVCWLSTSFLNSFIIFSGGLPETLSSHKSVTVMHGRSVVALEVGHPLVDFIPITATPWSCDAQDPKELAVLTQNELILVDLESSGHPLIDLGHPMDIHYSPVTCLKHVCDPNTDLIPGLYQVAKSKPKRKTASKKEWPIKGGEWNVHDCDGLPELIVTGHADGCVRFWDASAAFLKPIYKLRTKKVFKKSEECDTDHGRQISRISVCPESRTLVLVSGSSAVMVYKFATQETQSELNVLYVSQSSDLPTPTENGGKKENAPDENCQEHITEVDGNGNSDRKEIIESNPTLHVAFGVKSGVVRQEGGFQADLIALLSEEDHLDVTSMTINTSYQLLAVGTFTSIFVLDILRRVCVFNVSTSMVLRSIDRKIQIKSPAVSKQGTNGNKTNAFTFDISPSSADESIEMNGKPEESKTKRKAMTKKSRYATKSIGDYFSQSRSLLSFRRSSLVPKSPTGPPELTSHHAQTTICISSPKLDPSPDQEAPPAMDSLEPPASPLPASDKIKFVVGDEEAKKPESDTLKPELMLSRGSSIAESESSPQELVSFLHFANNCSKRSENMQIPSLWVGTSSGYLFNFAVHLPSNQEEHSNQQVILSPSNSLLKMKGGVVHCNFLDSSGHLISSGAGNWRDHTCAGFIEVVGNSESGEVAKKTVDQQFMVVCAEKRAKVLTLPSMACIRSVNFNNVLGQVTNASVDAVNNEVCLACLTSNGNLLVYGLPSLNLLLECQYFPSNNARISNTINFSIDGQIFYMPTPSEIQRLTYSLDTFEALHDCFCHLFVPRPSTERSNSGFFKNLFGAGVKTIDKNELFGETRNGRASYGLAQHVPGSGESSLEGMRGLSGGFAEQVRKLQLHLRERGEKLVEVEDRTEEMSEAALKFTNTTNALMMKYRNRKWYQF